MVIVQEGLAPLPRCGQCRIHMHADRLFYHRQTDKCNTEMERQIRRRDVEMTVRCSKLEFSMYKEEGGKMVEGVATLKYLGRTLDQTYDDWSVVRRNITRTRSVWGRLGKIMRREGEVTNVFAVFYRAVEQAVLLFESKTWALLAEMEWKVKQTHMCFLRQIMEKRACRLADWTWEMPRA